MRVIEQGKRLPEEPVESPSLKIPKPQLVLGSQLWVNLLRDRGTEKDHLQESLPTSTALGFCLTTPQVLQDRVKLQLKAVTILTDTAQECS